MAKSPSSLFGPKATVEINPAEWEFVMGQFNVHITVKLELNAGEFVAGNPVATAYRFDDLVGGPTTLAYVTTDSNNKLVFQGTIQGCYAEPNFAVVKATFMDENYEELEKSDVEAVTQMS